MAITRTNSRRSARHGEMDLQVLLIEDQRSLAQMAAKMLYERWGCRVLIATSLAQVRAIIDEGKHQFFVAVSDLNLPDASHGEVVDVLIAAKLKVIAITGMYDESMHDKIMSRGVVDYVLKDSINAYEYVVELVGRLFRNLHVKVLVVDDSQTFCGLISGMLQIQGLNVLTASNGAEALAQLAQQPDIKLVLVDHEMPVMDGFTFLSNVRRKHARDRLAVIGMSGAANSRMSAQFLKLGANDFICKPFSYEELVCRVTQNLEMQESIESVRYIAYHDYLTGLYNRRAFFEQGVKLFEETAGAGRTLAAAVMDIDFFKKINDFYGHDGGDVVLKHFARLLDEYFNAQLVGRVGGEEFFLLFPDADKAAGQCEAFRERVAHSAVKFNDAVIVFTISIGITRLASGSLDDMLKIADANLYAAKESGRNRIVLT
ncbi:MAG: diguanylate cyclase [Proteobacteria bacterium]|nr:diguanylate cyclase [Pseudomonadota bacterium]